MRQILLTGICSDVYDRAVWVEMYTVSLSGRSKMKVDTEENITYNNTDMGRLFIHKVHNSHICGFFVVTETDIDEILTCNKQGNC